jgi:glycosyltransferase involved in cell wall biosynthesis
MKIIQVIHGYPPQYNAGSENYTESISNEIASRGNEIVIFCREENPFKPEYELHEEIVENNSNIKKVIINIQKSRERFIHKQVDQAFNEVIEKFSPDIIHFQHLNHLSLTLPLVALDKEIPTVYTLHDYWLLCPRGQFIQYNLEGENWKFCDGQEDSKCAKACYSRYFSGDPDGKKDEEYWKNWIHTRMAISRKIADTIDYFISPSHTLYNYFISGYPEAKGKISYLDYGFNLHKLSGRKRESNNEPFVFGYIGTHIPAKGVDYLIKAFIRLKGKAILRVWGRPKNEQTPFLKELSNRIQMYLDNKIEWMGEFDGNRIIEDVFNKVDAIVVPSIWLENSPLVIHEAQQAKVPVITANAGGMAEYVKDGKNGLLFDFRNIDSLSKQMQRFLDYPEFARELGKTGYIYSKTGDVPAIEPHVDSLITIYNKLIEKHK